MNELKPGKHRKRLGYYVLWIILLMGSLVALGLWETPGRTGEARVSLKVALREAPASVKAVVWSGPRGHWGEARQTGVPLPIGGTPARVEVKTASLELPVAYRRWVAHIVPRRTSDLVVIRFEAPGMESRYFVLPLTADWAMGVLRPGGTMAIEAEATWEGLWASPKPDSMAR